MKVKHLISATGHASDWNRDNLGDHQKHSRIARKMIQLPQVARFVEHTDVPAMTEKDDGAYYPGQTYYQLSQEWVTTEELELLRECGVNPSVSRVELHDATWTAAIENKWVRASFVLWNVVLAAVALQMGGVF